ncbi:bZIP transcription factor [Aspergillus chevalieri]|uniref:BZIP domain-containing protein n=1 Tax=Aspergillus chevalieri TaxID=182096 RepID=A0A7R7VMM4_ASPCH|nr:uncharacterized protein ACHE_40014A [Aspergillus chevalieri]BCR87450.1 hypothetical protein ACHE_40014A [Aspergillus chevalieri]
MLHLELFGLFGLITPHPTHRPPPLLTAMSCSIGVQPTSTSIYDPWGASLSLWHADGQIEGLESIPPTFSTWDFPLGQDLYNPGLPLNTFHGPERSPKNDIGQQLSESLSTQPVPSNGQLKNRKSRGAKPAKTGIQKTSSRERFLERNRQAASRCRQKRKEHTQVLEERFKEQSTKHQQLQSEFRCLRMEILGLKNEVLKHAHCTDNHISEYLAQMLETVHEYGQQDRTSSIGGSSELESTESLDDCLAQGDLDGLLVPE